jgi:phosphatidylglycerophosphate synthase
VSWPEDFLETPAFELVARAMAGPSLVGRTVAQYRIEERLGAGGMGVVYRAIDTRLGRQVALKFLLEAELRDREARAAAALNHPNVCTIHEIGEFEGRSFLALELLEGKTLKQELGAGSLEPGKIVDIAVQVADALEAAHAQGIIHRDIKPANIFITTRGVVKVLDFGIARLPGSAEPQKFGTRAYMAPEQLPGGGGAGDERSDVFALGVVIREMVGTRPAGGLEPIIARCVAAAPAERFQSAAAVRSALRRDMTFVLAAFERRLLERMARRIPPSIRPNHFTALGMIGAVGAGVAYALTRYSPAWLWLASLMLLVHWLGDSLDGTLARVRGTERPRYGYYLDHAMGALSVVIVGIGIDLSGYLSPTLVLGLVVAYLTLAVNVYLESTVFGVLKVEYGRVGPTEARLVLILVNTALALGARPPMRIVDWTLAAALAAMVLVLVWRLGRNLSRLTRLDPRR